MRIYIICLTHTRSQREYNAVPVFLSDELVHKYYNGKNMRDRQMSTRVVDWLRGCGVVLN